MANIFAIKSGDWNDASVWDNNTIPTSLDVVYANAYTITINSDVDVNQLRNGSNSGQLPNMCIPIMTSNTTPSGVASASHNTTTAFYAFGQQGGIYTPGNVTAFTINYDFGAGNEKNIKRFRVASGYNYGINGYSFDYSDDGTNWFSIVAGNASNTPSGNILLSSILPTSAPHRYYRINVTSVFNGAGAVQVFSFTMTESIATPSSGTGGIYVVSTLPSGSSTRTITLRNSSSGLVNTAASLNLLQISAVSGTLNIVHATNGNIVNGSSLMAYGYNIYVTQTANCTVNINGNLFGDQISSGGASRDNAAFGIAGTVVSNITGNLTAGNAYAGSSFGSCAVAVLTNSGASTINISGNLFGQSTNLGSGAASETLYLGTNTATVNITGNINANLYAAIRAIATYTGTINITTSNINASASYYAILHSGTGAINITNSTVMASTTLAAIYSPSTSLITVNNSPLNNKNNIMAIFALRLRFTANSNPYWVFQDTFSQDITLSYGTASGTYPLPSNVKLGITYGQSPTQTGTCAVPLPQYVSQGVAIGSTVGTAYLNASDVWNVLTSTITTSGSIGERLKNASTVQTTGDQIASYQV